MIETLAIIGMGLMGGSLGLAAKAGGLAGCVRGYARRAAGRAQAVAIGAVDTAHADLNEAVAGADMVVLCVPVLTLSELLRSCAASLAAGAAVTDVGSTKQEVVAAAEAALRGCDAHFVGSHPIAGSEETGLAAARAALYRDAMTIVTPTAASDAGAVERVAGLWTGVGSRVAMLSPAEHDTVVARTSHLPHLAASMVMQAVFGDAPEGLARFCGTGFRDTTRVAAGSEEVWHDIIKTNRTAVSGELATLAAVIEDVRGMIARGDFDALKDFFARTRDWRRDVDGVRHEP